MINKAREFIFKCWEDTFNNCKALPLPKDIKLEWTGKHCQNSSILVLQIDSGETVGETYTSV